MLTNDLQSFEAGEIHGFLLKLQAEGDVAPRGLDRHFWTKAKHSAAGELVCSLKTIFFYSQEIIT